MNTKVISHFSQDKLIFDHAVVKEPDNRHYPFHVHERLEILYLVRGTATYIVENQSYRMKEYGIYIVSPGAKHRVKFDSAPIYERYDILPDASLLPECATQRITGGRLFTEIHTTDAIINLFRRMDSYYLRLDSEELKQMYYAMIKELALNLMFEAKRPGVEYKNTESTLVASALKYIDENICEISDVGQICKSLFVSRSYFYSVFTQSTGTSPKDYIRNKRLSLARDLIRGGKKPTEVYATVGFSDYTTFFRAYKVRFGYSPSKEIRLDRATHDLLT